jgi:glycosyltransferase involved in cell wall biosynthesis
VHINSDEYDFFRSHLPEKRHKLIYPPINMSLQARDDLYFLIVASGNYGNYESVAWFLNEVAPACPNIRVKIAGNVDYYFAKRRPDLLHKYRSSFLGRVEKLDKLYENAIAILLPTISGHGLSIKAVEALSTGLPIIATPQAFRGISIDFADYPNVHFAESAEAFTKCICAQYEVALDRAPAPANHILVWQTNRRSHQTQAQAAFNRQFSFDSYKDSLAAVAYELLEGDAATPSFGKKDHAIGSSSTSSAAVRC